MENKDIGTFIAKRRKEKGITQQQLADELNITNKAISKWETGNGLPDISVLTQLAKVLDVTVEEILEGKRASKEGVAESVIRNQDNIEAAPHLDNVEEKVDTAHEIASYLVNRSIERFKLMSGLCIAISIVGIIIPFSIWKETHDITGFLFGCWLEICSGGIFTYYYRIMKNEISSYNKTAVEKIFPEDMKKIYLNILIVIWVISLILLFGSSVA